MKKKILILLVSTALLVGVISGCIEEEKPTNEAPKASFTYKPDAIYMNTVINFTDTSTDDVKVASWSWDFDGDGVEDSSNQNPTHSYATVGDHIVNLTVTDEEGKTGTTTKTITVSYKPPIAAFTTDPDVAVVNITVNETTITFMDASTKGDADITNYTWDFGDGSNLVYTQNATHMYNSTGNYTVKLTIKDDNELISEASVIIEVKAAEE